jgi:hypothetical protein
MRYIIFSVKFIFEVARQRACGMIFAEFVVMQHTHVMKLDQFQFFE